MAPLSFSVASVGMSRVALVSAHVAGCCVLVSVATVSACGIVCVRAFTVTVTAEDFARAGRRAHNRAVGRRDSPRPGGGPSRGSGQAVEFGAVDVVFVRFSLPADCRDRFAAFSTHFLALGVVVRLVYFLAHMLLDVLGVTSPPTSPSTPSMTMRPPTLADTNGHRLVLAH